MVQHACVGAHREERESNHQPPDQGTHGQGGGAVFFIHLQARRGEVPLYCLANLS